MSTLSEVRAWLDTNGFTIIRQAIGPKGIELLVHARTGRIIEMIYKPGLQPSLGAQSLEEILADEILPGPPAA